MDQDLDVSTYISDQFFCEYLCDKLEKKGFSIVYGVMENFEYYDDYVMLLNKQYCINIRKHPDQEMMRFTLYKLNNRFILKMFLNYYQNYKKNEEITINEDKMNESISKYISDERNYLSLHSNDILYEKILQNMTPKQKFITIMKKVLEIIKKK